MTDTLLFSIAFGVLMVAFALLLWHDRNLALALNISAKIIADQEKRTPDAEKRVKQLETELLQTKRAGFDQLAKDLDVPVEDLIEGKIEVLLHDDPQAVYRALDNATASEAKFRQIKVVCGELKYVIGQIIERVAVEDLSTSVRSMLHDAASYSDKPAKMRSLAFTSDHDLFPRPGRPIPKLGQRPAEAANDHKRAP